MKELFVYDHTAHRIQLAEILQTKWRSTNLYEEFGKTIKIKQEVLEARKRKYDSDCEWEEM